MTHCSTSWSIRRTVRNTGRNSWSSAKNKQNLFISHIQTRRHCRCCIGTSLDIPCISVLPSYLCWSDFHSLWSWRKIPPASPHPDLGIRAEEGGSLLSALMYTEKGVWSRSCGERCTQLLLRQHSVSSVQREALEGHLPKIKFRASVN